jgi:xanthine/CO dehydrogenase XdhC/CoxF family maturation factor
MRSARSTERPKGCAMKAFRRLVDAIEAEGSAALVTLARVKGSSPREAGARMVVRPSGGFHGTIGGGALEWAALEAAQEALKLGRGPAVRRSLALGPELAQCCGGRVEWRIETFDRRDLGALESIATAEGHGPATVTAAFGADGRIERRLDGDRRGEGLTAVLSGEEGWTEPMGESARAVYLFRGGACRARACAGARPAALRGALDRLPARRLSGLRARQCRADPCAGARGRARHRPRRDADRGHDSFPRARPRDRRRGASL